MKRERQILQDVDRTYGLTMRFSENDEVSVLEEQNVQHDIEVPSRIEGRMRQKTVTVKKMAQTATYDNLDELFQYHKTNQNRHRDEAITVEQLPSDVVDSHDTWAEQDNVPTETDVRQALRDTANTDVNRLTATSQCPDCPRETAYACRTSGWARELYRYPLMKVMDVVSQQVYEVPLDAALYADLHPKGLRYGSTPQLSENEFISSYFAASLAGDTLSNEYVKRATNDTIQPEGECRIMPSSVAMEDIKVYMGGWQENGFNTYMDAYTAQKVADKLQQAVMTQHAERVLRTDYNEKFHKVKSELGKHGLALAFHYSYAGMGESDAVFMALENDNNARRPFFASSIDAYDALDQLHDMAVGDGDDK